ncbi:MAG: NAD(P)-dependent alcohol dehydrogenase [Candidatus Eisenbacteria bacterium]|uniref:NAD(P)-dependent alcohol dehydrogenase n=1 Tax=Eiseniibacteriota bacterium TaxID=2212470 RepID=A0A956NC77_UNCEI|nr:NAD(P)-dependent alcohol dehydrogenase [Candidatus Eisenbacteria bacterium]MCB9465828.1 NAD(P)-dependent alcohol dehydrogenase [Candidatus Eisenbacteria bacterium]
MKAVIHEKYGPPSVLRLDDVPIPEIGDDEVRVRIRAASANAGDWHLMRADPFVIRFMFGFLKPKHRILGSDFAGTIEAVGSGVSEFQIGDDVMGELSESGFGAFAEFARVPAASLVRKPTRLSFGEAAAVPVAAKTALHGLRDKGRIAPGMRVLVNGASGGVGTYAVQIAKHFSAHVIGVCSTRNVELVRSLGADEVIDYTREDFLARGAAYDLLLDIAAVRPLLACRRALTSRGTYVMVGGGPNRRFFQTLLMAPALSRKDGRRVELLLPQPGREDLEFLAGLLENGDIRVSIDQTFPLDRVPEAIQYMETGRARGKVVIDV